MIKPYYKRSGITLYHSDCKEIFPYLAAVDSIVTDPPFGIGFDRATWSDASAEYPSLMKMLVNESNRLVQCGRVFVFQAMPNCSRFHEWFPTGWRIFAACKNFAQIRTTRVWHSFDPVVFWENGKPKPSSDTINRDYHVGNVAGVFNIGNSHPCPRPLDTMIRLAEIAACEGQTILDPFAGSGTTGVACVKTARRLDAEISKGNLFAETDKTEAMEQACMFAE